MHKHLSWILPENYEQKLLTNSLPFQNKEIFFSIPQSQKLTIQFKINADLKSIGLQVFEFRFELKKNDEVIFTTPSIKRKFRDSAKNPFNQTLNIDSSEVFNQTQNKYVVEIDAQELESSGAPTPDLPKVIRQDSSNIQSSPTPISKKIGVDQIDTPDHIFSPIRLKKEVVKLDSLDKLETNTPNPKPREDDIIDIKSEAFEVNTNPITAIQPINSNDVILDSPVEQKEDDDDSDNDDDEITNPSSSTDSLATFTTASSFLPRTVKKKKNKKLLSDYKLPKLTSNEPSISNSQPIKELSKSISLPFKSFVEETTTISESQPLKKQQNYPTEKEEQETSTETYCGLYNQGTTCYMNSMLQAFYHLPAFRRLIYKMDTSNGTETDNEEEKEKNIKSNIPLQLQKLFAVMQTTKESACSTRDLTRSFGWTDEDTIMQHDVQEFCRVLLDNLETKIDKQPHLKGSIQNLFRGKYRSFIRCINVDFESKRDEYFYDLSLDVKGCRNLKESFYKYIENEKFTGDNQYDTGDPRYGKQDAVMGNEFLQFPPVLHLHLKRFEFDGNGMSKINSRFEFPLEINLGKFMPKDAENRNEQIFELFGVLVHSGTVDGGHYYAFLRPTEKQKWYEFNDSSVSLSSVKDAVENNYGGCSNDDFRSKLSTSSNDRFNLMFKNHRIAMMQRNHHHHHQQQQQQLHQRWFSAYMLIYVRKSEVPILYEKVLDDEIPSEIKELIQKQEELRRKKEEQKRIQENTINFHIFTFVDISNQVSKTNKFNLPNVNDYSIGKKFTALRGETFSVLYDKIMDDFEKENEENNSFFIKKRENVSFEFWQILGYSFENKPVDLNKKIDFPRTQGLFVYINDKKQEDEKENDDSKQQKQTLLNPYILVFTFIYCPALKNPISPLKVIKVNKQDKIKSLFDNLLELNGIHCRSVFKGTQLQTVQEITDIDSTFEQNLIKSGSFLVFEIFETKMPERELELSTEKDKFVKRYMDVYMPESVIEYFDIIKNMSSIKIITTESNILENSSFEYQFFFPTNRNFQQFIQFIKYTLKIPEIRTVVLYESRSKKPLMYKKEQSLSEKGRIDSIKLFQFDSISENVFQHSLLISFKIFGSFVEIVDSTFNCWMNEESTVADLLYYVECSYIIQLKLDYQNDLERRRRRCIDEKISHKQSIRERVILNYSPSDGQNLRLYITRREGCYIYPPDKKLSEIDSTLFIDICAEDQSLIKESTDKIEKSENKSDDSVHTFLLTAQITENAMNKITGFKDQGVSFLTVVDDETLISIKKRIAFLLNKDDEFFINSGPKIFSFSLIMGNNAYMKVVPKDDEKLSVYMKKGYTKLRVALLMSEIGKTSLVSHSSSRDDSVVIKN